MSDLYETLRARAASLSEDEFVAYAKHPVLLFDFADDEVDTIEITHASVAGRPIALSRGSIKTARFVARSGAGAVLIGRADDCDITINHASISKYHAEIVVRPDHSLAIRDAGSRHGVFVNDHRISSTTLTPLVNGDDVAIGSIAATLVYPQQLFRLLRGDDKPSPWRSLRNRAFAALWIGQSISQIGDGLYRIALLWWVLQTTGSGVALGALALFQTIPMLALLLLGGVVVDRISRARVMLASDLARGLVTAAIAALGFTSRLESWHVYVAAIVFGLADAFFVPAYTAIVPQLVRPSDRPSANALTSISWQVGGIAGSALGAILVASVGTTATFAIEAASFFICAACLVPCFLVLRRLPSLDTPAERRGVLRDLRDGLVIVATDPWLWITIVAYSLTQAIDQAAFLVALPYRIKTTLHLGVASLGMVQTLFFIGTLAATIWMSRVELRHRGTIWYVTLAGLGLCIVCFGLPITIYGMAVAALLRGVALSVIIMIWLDTVQRRVPHDKLGRVNSIDTFGSTIATPFGLAVAGWLADHTILTPAFVIGGIAVMVIAALALLHPAIRAVD